MRLVNLTPKSAIANRRYAVPLGKGLVLVAVAWLWWYSNPLHRSKASVRAWVLERTPLGTRSEEVQTIAQTQGWVLASACGAKHGFYIVGAVGDYWSLPFNTHVTAFWFFDDKKSNGLVRVYIEKPKY